MPEPASPTESASPDQPARPAEAEVREALRDGRSLGIGAAALLIACTLFLLAPEPASSPTLSLLQQNFSATVPLGCALAAALALLASSLGSQPAGRTPLAAAPDPKAMPLPADPPTPARARRAELRRSLAGIALIAASSLYPGLIAPALPALQILAPLCGLAAGIGLFLAAPPIIRSLGRRDRFAHILACTGALALAAFLRFAGSLSPGEPNATLPPLVLSLLLAGLVPMLGKRDRETPSATASPKAAPAAPGAPGAHGGYPLLHGEGSARFGSSLLSSCRQLGFPLFAAAIPSASMGSRIAGFSATGAAHPTWPLQLAALLGALGACALVLIARRTAPRSLLACAFEPRPTPLPVLLLIAGALAPLLPEGAPLALQLASSVIFSLACSFSLAGLLGPSSRGADAARSPLLAACALLCSIALVIGMAL